MAIQETLQEIKRQFEKLARREDIRQLKDKVDKLFEKMSERMDKLDSRCFDIEKGMDSIKEEIDAVKKENADLREQLRQQERRVTKVLSNHNDLEQCESPLEPQTSTCRRRQGRHQMTSPERAA